MMIKSQDVNEFSFLQWCLKWHLEDQKTLKWLQTFNHERTERKKTSVTDGDKVNREFELRLVVFLSEHTASSTQSPWEMNQSCYTLSGGSARLNTAQTKNYGSFLLHRDQQRERERERERERLMLSRLHVQLPVKPEQGSTTAADLSLTEQLSIVGKILISGSGVFMSANLCVTLKKRCG